MLRYALKKSILMLVCLLGMQSAYADHLLECPTVEALSRYAYGVALPYGYHKQTKSVQFIVVVTEPATQEGYPRFGLVLYPVSVSFSEDPKVKTRELLNQLVVETPVPVNYHIARRTTIPMCVYSLPGKNKFTAFLFANDGEDVEGHFNLKSSQGKMDPREQAMKFLKFVNVSQT